MRLVLELGNDTDMKWAQEMVVAHHYLHTPVHPIARPMVYVLRLDGRRVGLVMVALPHAARCRGWWGYVGLPTQWQTLDLCRIWLDPELQGNGRLCRPDVVPGFIDRRGAWRPSTPSWMIETILGRVQEDRVSLYPPVYLEQPYHIRLVISYHDPLHHKGTIYKATNALPMYTDEGTAVPGPSGKFGWCWQLDAPLWQWQDIHILKPRTIRMF